MTDNDSFFYTQPKLLKEVLKDIKNSGISVRSIEVKAALDIVMTDYVCPGYIHYTTVLYACRIFTLMNFVSYAEYSDCLVDSVFIDTKYADTDMKYVTIYLKTKKDNRRDIRFLKEKEKQGES